MWSPNLSRLMIMTGILSATEVEVIIGFRVDQTWAECNLPFFVYLLILLYVFVSKCFYFISSFLAWLMKDWQAICKISRSGLKTGNDCAVPTSLFTTHSVIDFCLPRKAD